jgi:hypothetical protein
VCGVMWCDMVWYGSAEVACMREMRWEALEIGRNGCSGVGIPLTKAGYEERDGGAGVGVGVVDFFCEMTIDGTCANWAE